MVVFVEFFAIFALVVTICKCVGSKREGKNGGECSAIVDEHGVAHEGDAVPIERLAGLSLYCLPHIVEVVGASAS